MICYYCQQECQPVTQGLLPNNLYENRIAQCIPCNVGYYKSFHSINCTMKDQEFSVSYMDDYPGHWTSVYRHTDRLHDIVLSFKFHVRFTPTNFKEKLKLYLLFS